jgi:PAS domain S-box-containing protein
MESEKELIDLLKSVFNASNDGLFICDKKGHALLFNDALLKITDVDKEVMVTHGIFELLQNDYVSESSCALAIKNKTTQVKTIKYKTGITTKVTSIPFLDNFNDILFVVTSVRDITQINKLQGELIESKKIVDSYEKTFKNIKMGNSQHSIIYHSKEMEKVISQASQFATNNSPVLILGESGVGKDVFAEYIHRQSNRRGELIKVNCGAIPDQLLESELFGYERGAYTGANKEKRGLFELADKGTIFLDEIGDMPYPLQVKLLHVLEDYKIRRIGSTESVNIDVRIIVATNADLQSLIAENKFRLDLYYRLNVLGLTIPPLRERREDIPPLLFYNLRRLQTKYGEYKRIGGDELEHFINYDWPGNTRELINMTERMYHMSQDKSIVFGERQLKQIPNSPIQRYYPKDPKLSYHDAVEAFERKFITNALNRAANMKECAEELGISMSTLVRRKRKLGI